MAPSPEKPIIVQGKPLYCWASTWDESDGLSTCFGTVPATSQEEAEAYALMSGRAQCPQGVYISHGAHLVTDGIRQPLSKS